MRKQKYMLSFLLCAGACAALITGCGGEYAGLPEGDAVSSSAVSGAAVSGNAVRTDAVSGGAADVPDKKAASNEKTGDWNQYTFSNDSHVYYADLYDDNVNNGKIIEYDWKDRSERKISKKDLDQILYVDNDWVYYSTLVVTENDEEDTFQGNLWRAPVEAGMLRDEKEELLFTEEEGFYSCRLPGDGRYLIYMTISDNKYKKYDLKEKRFIRNFDFEDDEYIEILGVTGEQIVLDLESGLACQDIAGESVDVISEYAPACKPLVAMSDSDVFYVEDGYSSDEIWRYHLADGSREKLGAKRQIKELLRGEGFLDASGGKKHKYYVDHLVAAGDRLYIQIDISWEENGVAYRNKVMCSVKAGGGENLRYEKELTKCLKNPKENQKVFTKYYYRANSEEVLFFSRGSVIAASGQQIYFCLYEPKKDKNTLACYDLTSGSLKFLTKKDEESIRLLAEGILPFENWDGPEYFRPRGLSADTPNENVLDLLW